MSIITFIIKHLIRVAHLEFQRLNPLSSWFAALSVCRMMYYNLICRPRVFYWHAWQYPEQRKAPSLPQWHTSFKTIPIPTKPHFILAPLPMKLYRPITFKLPLCHNQVLFHTSNSRSWFFPISPCNVLNKLFFLLYFEGTNHVTHANPSATVMDTQVYDSSG